MRRLAAAFALLALARRLVRRLCQPALLCTAGAGQRLRLLGLERLGIGNAFLRAGHTEAELAAGDLPRTRHRRALGRDDAELSAVVEIYGIGGAIGRHLDRLTNDF